MICFVEVENRKGQTTVIVFLLALICHPMQIPPSITVIHPATRARYTSQLGQCVGAALKVEVIDGPLVRLDPRILSQRFKQICPLKTMAPCIAACRVLFVPHVVSLESSIRTPINQSPLGLCDCELTNLCIPSPGDVDRLVEPLRGGIRVLS